MKCYFKYIHIPQSILKYVFLSTYISYKYWHMAPILNLLTLSVFVVTIITQTNALDFFIHISFPVSHWFVWLQQDALNNTRFWWFDATGGGEKQKVQPVCIYWWNSGSILYEYN